MSALWSWISAKPRLKMVVSKGFRKPTPSSHVVTGDELHIVKKACHDLMSTVETLQPSGRAYILAFVAKSSAKHSNLTLVISSVSFLSRKKRMKSVQPKI